MDSRSFNVFHDPRNKDILTVADCIDFQFDSHEILIDENRIFDLLTENDFHIFFDIIVIESDDHVLAAQHVGRTHQNRITDFIGRAQGFFSRHDRYAGCTLYIQSL